MSEQIWMSTGMRGGSSFEHGFFPDFGPELEDQAEVDKTYEITRRVGAGEVVPKDEMPTKFYHSRNEHFDEKLPGFFGPVNFLFTPKIIETFNRYDMGNGYFLPVQLYQFDRTTPIEQEASILCIGNAKDTVRRDETPRMRPYYDDVFSLSGVAREEEDFVRTKASALQGADIWADPHIDDAWFMSEGLAKALIKAGLKNTLNIVRTKTT
ncbi:hypothetical protein [Actibacterium ureilyticum]|uniref:hypothetical protein n=1 Tax=Actibacterium ureilyticum TaxID=1590614 RepID=UPI000BAAD988|nr:hypothetical protein [Actibacterium ureilyticum]